MEKNNNMQNEQDAKSNNKMGNAQGQKPGDKKGQQKKGSNKKSLIFFGVMVIIYVVLYFISPDKTLNSIKYVLNIIKEILPILILVYIFMLGFAFINEQKLKASIEKAPMAIKYMLMSALGTLSHGPIYAWYPFLKELNKKGLSKGAMGTFLYARGIKLTLLPMLVSFFDLKFAVILTITTLLFSIIEGIIIDLTCKS